MVHGKCPPYWGQTTEQSSCKLVVELPSATWVMHAFCWWQSGRIQGATTSSHIPPPLLQDQRPCIQLMCAERHAPCQWNLAIDQDKPAVLVGQWQGHEQTDLQYQARGCGHSEATRATDKAWAWGPHPLWFGAVRTACDIQVDGRGGGAGRP